MAQQALRRKQAAFLVQDGTEEFVRGAEALHEDIALSVVNHADRLGHGFKLVLDIHNLEFGHVDLALSANFGDKVCVAYQGNFHKALVGRQGSGLDGVGVHAPGGDHTLANTLRLELGEQIVEIGNHNYLLILVIQY